MDVSIGSKMSIPTLVNAGATIESNVSPVKSTPVRSAKTTLAQGTPRMLWFLYALIAIEFFALIVLKKLFVKYQGG